MPLLPPDASVEIYILSLSDGEAPAEDGLAPGRAPAGIAPPAIALPIF